MARMSNRERIARAAEEARLAEAEKKAEKPSSKAKVRKKAAKRTPRSRAKEVRMKLVWVIYNSSGKPVKTFAYPDKDAGTVEAQQLSGSTGHPHELRAVKVPME